MKKVSAILIILLLVLLIGCGKKELPYEASLIRCGQYGHRFEYNNTILKDEFIYGNTISGCDYLNPSYDSTDPYSQEYISYNESPKSKTIIISSKNYADDIFVDSFNIDYIDYDKELLILYIFPDCNCSYKIEDVTNDMQKLVFNVKYKIRYTTSPQPTFLLIKIKKVEFEDVSFNIYRDVK